MATKKTNSGTAGRKSKTGAAAEQTAAEPRSGMKSLIESFSQKLAARKKHAGKTGIEPFVIELLENFLSVIKKYTVVTGRARRKEFWMFVLAGFIIGVIFSILAAIPILGILFRLASFLFSLATIIPSITVGVRRLHDTNKTGWLMLLGLIPIAGIIILIVWTVQEGTPGSNKYGPNPKK